MVHPIAALPELAVAFRNRLTRKEPLAEPLKDLLNATGGQATGLWRLRGGVLELLGFQAVEDMPREVRREFVAATQRVPLDQAKLGIVKAALTGTRVIVQPETPTPDVSGSVSWLARFAAHSSCAVPIIANGHVAGVLAVSFTDLQTTDSPASQLLEALASHVAAALLAE